MVLAAVQGIVSRDGDYLMKTCAGAERHLPVLVSFLYLWINVTSELDTEMHGLETCSRLSASVW